MKWLKLNIILLLIIGCTPKKQVDGNDKLIASYNNEKLYLSNLEGFFPDGSTASDSSNILNTFIENWVREKILLAEAEKYIADDIDVDQLVQDYKESLLTHNYESQLVEERLDTIITQEEKKTFYDLNRRNFLLAEKIGNIVYAIIPEDNPEMSSFKKDWIKQNRESASQYCEKYGVDHSFNDPNWITFARLKSKLPEELFSDSQLRSRKSLDKVKDGDQYFVKVYDYKDENEEAPLAYIEDKIEKVLLYNRKVSLLREIKEKLYERELEFKRIKIYTNK